jgi:hypothetical protein
MKHCLILFFSTLIINLLTLNNLFAQAWNFVKEKEGIKVYTRHEPNSALKSFKGEAIINAPVDNISFLIMDPNHADWWEKNFTQRKLLEYHENNYIRYYLVYNLPWPFVNRDFVAETRITKDAMSGEQIMVSIPVVNIVSVKPGLIRIEKYSQKWILQPMDKQNVHVILEGFIDPGGNVPSWLYNIVLPETPFKIINALRDRLLSDRSVWSGE